MLTIAGGILLAAVLFFVGRAVFIWAGIGLLKRMDRSWEKDVANYRKNRGL